jgi:hypothetical protein
MNRSKAIQPVSDAASKGCIECLRALHPFGEVSADDHMRVSTIGMVLRLYDHPVFR